MTDTGPTDPAPVHATRRDQPSERDRPAAAAVWRELLPGAVLVAGAVPWCAPGALDHLGDPDGERVELLSGRPVLVPRLAHGHLRLTGADRTTFLHGLVSHDVRALPDGGAVDALLLDHRGQPQAGLTVVRRPDDLFVAVDDGHGERVRRALVDHVVFDEVEVGSVDDRVVTLTLVVAAPTDAATVLDAVWPGAGAPLAGAAPGAAVHVAAAAGRALLRGRPFGARWAVDVHVLVEDLRSSWSRWGAGGVRVVGERAWTAGRVACAAATVLGEGRLGLPQETGLEGRVSYHKGCYLGQEIMARVEARGRVRRGLRTLRLDGPPPGLGAATGWRLEDGRGRAIGALGSAAPAPDGDGWRALAVVRIDAVDTGAWRVVVDGEGPRAGPSEVRASLLDAPPGG